MSDRPTPASTPKTTPPTVREALTVVLVDDDDAVRDSLAVYLQTHGWQVLEARDGHEALAIAADGRGDIFITDIRMPGMDGLTLLRRLHERDPHIEVLVTTGFSNESAAIEALKAGAFDYFSKPLDAVQVEAALQRTRRYRAMRVENERLHAVLAREGEAQSASTYVGESAASRTLLEQLSRLATAPSASVLLQGESGVGKEVAARLLHHLTRDGKAPFVALNCGGLPDTLLESELFGHEKGAYTGADRRTAGVFEMAIGGTVLLDEISEMSPHAQSRFLRVLEDRRLRRLGGSAEVALGETRIIATTNRDLLGMVADGSFREDLYYRLQVVTLTLPPLRDRRADILPLARHFAQRFSGRHSRTLVYTPTAEAALCAHDFPGNIRELRNRVERATIFATGEEIGPLDLGLVPLAAPTAPPADAESAVPDTLNLHEAERRLIERAMASESTHAAASRSLGITPQALYRKLEKHGLAAGGAKAEAGDPANTE